MKDLIIVGAGGFGREALYLALDINKQNPQWNIKGFIDDNEKALDSVRCDYPIIGKISEWQPKENEVFAMGIAAPKTKEILAKLLKEKGAKFISLISIHTIVWPFVTIGEGCVISGSIGDNVVIGDFVHIAGSMIGQDSIIGDYSTTTGYVNVAGATLGKRVFVGSHAMILNHTTIGDDAEIYPGSMVIRKVKPCTKVFGMPAKEI